MAARTEEVVSAQHIARELEKIAKDRNQNKPGIGRVLGCAEAMKTYVGKETDKKKKAEGKKMIKVLTDLGNKMDKDYNAHTQTVREKARDIMKFSR